MKKPHIAASALTLAALVVTSVPGSALASESLREPSQSSAQNTAYRPDNLPGPQTEKQRKKRLKAQEKLAKGTARANKDGVVKLGSNNFVETQTTRNDKVFTILSEFGDKNDPARGSAPGPLHNQIPQPDRAQNNSTLWSPDFNTEHYNKLFNGPSDSMKDYFEKQSNGKYSVTNFVQDWVKLPNNASFYGDNTVENKGGSWQFIKDSGNSWWDAQIASGKTPAQIDQYLSQFDVWDRNDFDNDGDFNEPDGYIDHFQAIHSGEGEEAGGGEQGEDAIWSHRWFAYGNDFGKTGPSGNLGGGTQIGQSKYWIGDYTTEPENGGLGVFAHEYAHDLGIPDFYDSTNKGENGTGFWTLMSGGSWLGRPDPLGNGDTPGGMGPEEKLFMGWLRGSNVPMGSTENRTLNPSQFQVDGQDQAVRIDLPNKNTRITFPTPVQGKKSWWSGSQDSLNGSLSANVPAQRSTVTASAALWWDTEQDYDFLYPEYSVDGGKTWTLATNTATGKAEGLSGKSEEWKNLTFQYNPAGKASIFRFRYASDGGVNGTGAFIDSLQIKNSAGKILLKTDAEKKKLPKGFTADKNWVTNPGYLDKSTEQFYLIENRQYQGYDAVLETGPYNFGNSFTKPGWVQTFPYTPGMLVWYVDRSFDDNNTSTHPGGGSVLPVDARIDPLRFSDGTAPGGRRISYDATFGKGQYKELCLTKELSLTQTVKGCSPAGPQSPTFDDTNVNAYYDPSIPNHSVKVAGHGVKATVTGQNPDGSLTVSVTNPAG